VLARFARRSLTPYTMEKWKIAVIATLLISLLGFGMYQQKTEDGPSVTQGTPAGTPLPSPYDGKVLPTWNFKTWSGQPVSLESLRGKPVLVEIFRIQCPHCQDAAPFMDGVQDRYGARGLKVIGIQSPGRFDDTSNPENSWPAVQTWMKRFGIKYPVAFDQGSKYFQGTIKDKIFGGNNEDMRWPTLLLLDKQGRVSMAHTGYSTDRPEDMTKILNVAVTLEKTFPGSKSTEENAASLVKWLSKYLPGVQGDEAMTKALTDEVVKRLK
jgi:thiol-disulfide isomerase/thioredoxin